MGRFKAGDRVKILAGHPYWLADDAFGGEGRGVYVRKANKKECRARHLVKVVYDNGSESELAFKGRELELLPAEAPAEQWVPKAGDRVRFKIDNPNGGARYGKAGQDVAVVGDRGTSSPYGRQVAVEDTGCGFKPNAPVSALEPLPVAEQPTTPTPLTIEAGKFYRTRDGRKVGPIELSKHTLDNKHPFRARVDIDFPAAVSVAIWQNDGTNYEYRWLDLIAEWVDEPFVAVEAVSAKETGHLRFKIGDRVDLYRDGKPVEFWRALTITSFDEFFDYNTDRGLLCFDGELQLATPTPTPIASPTTTPSFIVARLTPTGKPLPNTRPTVHASREAAETEAQRLADKYGDDFAVYERVSVRELDAGPVPDGYPLGAFDPLLARQWVEQGNGRGALKAFNWKSSKQGGLFWNRQYDHLTPLGRAILTKWIAQAEATTTPATPANDDAPTELAA